MNRKTLHKKKTKSKRSQRRRRGGGSRRVARTRSRSRTLVVRGGSIHGAQHRDKAVHNYNKTTVPQPKDKAVHNYKRIAAIGTAAVLGGLAVRSIMQHNSSQPSSTSAPLRPSFTSASSQPSSTTASSQPSSTIAPLRPSSTRAPLRPSSTIQQENPSETTASSSLQSSLSTSGTITLYNTTANELGTLIQSLKTLNMCSDNTDYLGECKTKVDDLYNKYNSDLNINYNTQQQNDTILFLVNFVDTLIEMVSTLYKRLTDYTNTQFTPKEKDKYMQDLNVDEINQLADNFYLLEETVTEQMIVIYNFLELKQCVALKGVYKVKNIEIQQIVNVRDELNTLFYYLTPGKCTDSNNINSLVMYCVEVNLFLNPPQYPWKSNVEAELQSRIENDDTIFTAAKTKINACFQKLNLCNSSQATQILIEINKIKDEINVETYTYQNYNTLLLMIALAEEIGAYILGNNLSTGECDHRLQLEIIIRKAQNKLKNV